MLLLTLALLAASMFRLMAQMAFFPRMYMGGQARSSGVAEFGWTSESVVQLYLVDEVTPAAVSAIRLSLT